MTALPSGDRPAIAALLLQQAGVISRAQARAAGLSGDAVDRRLAARAWVPLHPRVYRATSHPPSDEGRVRAALLWAGEGVVLSGLAAAWWHGLLPAPCGELGDGRIAVTVPRRRAPRSRAGVAVRRRDLAAEDVIRHRGVLVTAWPLTVLEAGVELGVAAGPFLDRVLRSRSDGGFGAVSRAYSRNLGCAGSATMRALLVAAGDRSAGAARRLLVARLREAGIVGWCVPRAAAHELLFPGARIVVRVHSGLAARGSHGAREGWAVLTYSWHDLAGQPERVLADITATVTTARRAG